MIRKTLLATVLGLFLMVGQAMATTTTLTFDEADLTSANLSNYYDGVTISGWNLMPNTVTESTDIYKKLSSTSAITNFATVAFASAVKLISFDYSISAVTTNVTATLANGNTVTAALPLNDQDTNAAYLPDNWGDYLITSFTFNFVKTTNVKASSLDVDNITYAKTPLPGAAVFFVSGLLGMVGLHRRQVL